MKYINSLNKDKGITIVALVITIIILLILTGIALNSAIGENGIITRAKQANNLSKLEDDKEKLNILVAEIYLIEIEEERNYELYEIEELLKTQEFNIVKENTVVSKTGSVIVVDSKNNNRFTILKFDKKYNIKEGYEENNIIVTHTLSTQEKTDKVVITITAQDILGIKEIEKPNGEIVNSSTTEYTVYSNGKYQFKIQNNNGNMINYVVEIRNIISIEDDLLKTIYINEYEDGIHTIKVNNVDLQINIKNFEEDVVYTTSPAIETTVDGPMVVLKYNKNLTINPEVTITPQDRSKGMFILVKGKLINNGTITMTKRGANAEGDNIYLWKNSNGTYEYVPAVGATETVGVSVTNTNYDKQYILNASTGYHKYGVDGKNAIDRQTGGGGTGSSTIHYTTNTAISGNGSAGTSYSGGSGGGGAVTRSSSTKALSGISGGIGGKASAYTDTGSVVWYAGGGAGPIGGNGMYKGSTGVQGIEMTNDGYKGEDGAGGLLIIYSDILINKNIISSNGSQGGGSVGVDSPGGSSGGGSINIFYKTSFENNASITAEGGKATTCTYRNSSKRGSNGGNGSINSMKINF